MKTEELNELVNARWEAIFAIEKFIKKNKDELIKEICNLCKLDPIKNDVRVYGNLGHVAAYFKDNGPYRRTHELSNSGDGWKEV